MKILIAVPTFENIMPETFRAIYECGAGVADFEFVKGYDCAKARNEIVRKATNGEYDYVLMVDSDVIIPKDTLTLLLEGEPDIITGIIPKKNTKVGEAELFKLGQKNFVDRFLYSELPENERIEVKGGGFGCALVKCSVFKSMKYPWFKYVSYDSGSFLSEDLYFFNEARKAGYKILADTRVKCGHAVRYFQYE